MSASALFKLQKVGFSAEQVEALADFMDTQAASKADLSEAKGDLKGDIAALRTQLFEVKADLKVEIAGVRTEIAGVRTDMAKWIISAVMLNAVVVLGGMLGLARLLHP